MTVSPLPLRAIFLPASLRRNKEIPIELSGTSGGSNDTGELVMDWDRVQGNWKQFKGRAKEKWGNLTDDDLDRVAGKREQLEGIIQQRYGLAKDQVRKDVDTWLNSV